MDVTWVSGSAAAYKAVVETDHGGHALDVLKLILSAGNRHALVLSRLCDKYLEFRRR